MKLARVRCKECGLEADAPVHTGRSPARWHKFDPDELFTLEPGSVKAEMGVFTPVAQAKPMPGRPARGRR